MPKAETTSTRTASRNARSGSKARTTKGRSTTARAQDAIALLKADHKEVSDLVARYEAGKDRMADSKKAALAEEICRDLTVHAQIEEEIFYPACRDHVEDAEELLAEARVEHQSLKELIAKIQENEPGSEEFDAQVKVLGEYTKHHVKEEQNELFPKVRKSDMDLKALGAELAERKQELMAAAG
jgi:hemerythrin superfamily protein